MRTAESGMGEKITSTVVQNGARRNAAMLQRASLPVRSAASLGRAAAQPTSR